MALRRLQKELRDIQKDMPPGILSCAPVQLGQPGAPKPPPGVSGHAVNSPTGSNGSELFVWKATIAGPEGTAFADGTFSAIITFPTDYPFKPPRFQVVTRVYHPNINQNGGACLDILKDSWSPALTASRVLSAFVDLLERPVLEDPLRPDVAILYRNDYPTFYRRAREMTERYAMPQAGLGRDTSATPEPMPLPRTPAQDHHLHVSKHARRLSDMEQRDRGTRLAPLELPPLDAAIHVATGGRRQSLAHAVTMNLS